MLHHSEHTHLPLCPPPCPLWKFATSVTQWYLIFFWAEFSSKTAGSLFGNLFRHQSPASSVSRFHLLLRYSCDCAGTMTEPQCFCCVCVRGTYFSLPIWLHCLRYSEWTHRGTESSHLPMCQPVFSSMFWECSPLLPFPVYDWLWQIGTRHVLRGRWKTYSVYWSPVGRYLGTLGFVVGTLHWPPWEQLGNGARKARREKQEASGRFAVDISSFQV